jgi:hypothetical protein
MRRLIAVAAVAAAGFGIAAPAQAQYQCVGTYSPNGNGAGVCTGSWCADECFVVAFVQCHDVANAGAVQAVDVCNDVLDGLGAPPPGYGG